MKKPIISFRKKMGQRTGIPRLIVNRKPTLKDINAIMLEISNFLSPFSIRNRTIQRAKAMKKVFQREMDLRPEELAAKRKIKVPGSRNKISPRGKNKLTPIWGCHSECLIMHRALKALEKEHGIKLNPRLVLRKYTTVNVKGQTITYPHTELLFNLNGNLYRADPFNEVISKVSKSELKDAVPLAPKQISFTEFKRLKGGRAYQPLRNPESNEKAPVEEWPLGI
jgi:hypothetical protein